MQKKKIILCLLSIGLLLASCKSKNSKYELKEVPSDMKELMKNEVEIRTSIIKEEFPIKAITDSKLAPGTIKTIQKGSRGESQVKMELTYRSGKLISNKALSEVVITRSRPEIIHYGPLNGDPSPDGKVYILSYSTPDMIDADYKKLLADKGIIPLSDEMLALAKLSNSTKKAKKYQKNERHSSNKREGEENLNLSNDPSDNSENNSSTNSGTSNIKENPPMESCPEGESLKDPQSSSFTKKYREKENRFEHKPLEYKEEKAD